MIIVVQQMLNNSIMLLPLSEHICNYI